MDEHSRNFFTLLRFVLGNGSTGCPVLTLPEWQGVYDVCQRQGLLPFVGHALSNTSCMLKNDSDKVRPEFARVIMRWVAAAMQCENVNRNVSRHAVEVARRFEREGFECCLLKGQGNALLYPEPSVRTPGDIDLWVRPRESASRPRNAEEDCRKVIAFVRKMDANAEIAYHHVECPDFEGTPVEAHYRPQFMFSLRNNKRLQSYFAEKADAQFAHRMDIGEGMIAIPTPEFNVVFQISHIFNHLFHEGIGLRQLLDYYYVITRLDAAARQQDWSAILGRVGLRGITGGVMWILVHCFGMAEEKAIVPLDERRGRFVLNEILQGGNFGKYDQRDHFGQDRTGRNLQRLWRDLRLLAYFPVEAVSEPLFRLWHYGWRLRHRPSVQAEGRD